MPRPLRSSSASRGLGSILAISACMVAMALGLSVAASTGPYGGPAGPLESFGANLLGAFSWAAIFVPLWLAAAALLCFLPGFRPAAILGLAGSVLPFLPIAAFARIALDKSDWFQRYPALDALGLPALGAAAGLLALFLSLLVARIVLALLSRGVLSSHDAPAEASPRRLLAAYTTIGAGTAQTDAQAGPDHADVAALADADESQFVFRVPTLPPPPTLLSSSFREAAGAAAAAEKKPPVSPDAGPGDTGEYDDVEDVVDPDDAGIEKIDIGGACAVKFTTVQPGKGGTVVAAEGAGPERIAGKAVDDDGQAAAIAAAAREAAALRILAGRKPKAYVVPIDGLLNAYPDGQYWIIDDKTRRSAEVLRETLAEFNIKAEVTGIRKGPVITMFEILPAPGVRLSKIANLADNIALRLAASSVRIVAPIPGKHAVGIEVPNERRSIVSLREIAENEAFRTTKMEIPVALGKDIAGEAQFVDLVQTPHLLIAGATGSGKSVCVNSIILSVLFRRSPEEVRLILIDPKIVELKLYNDVPHLLTPVITEPKRAFQALQYCICEMERRYTMLDRLGVRDIKSYNRKIREKALVQERLPYIVVIIDEFADLMATTGKELESTLARLAAMSRAVGIHLVLATQRPSIDVITGLIKANIPSRIAFMVASKFDSRIIIDMVGAEKLLGRGDMLFASAWDPFPIRMQGAFVSEDEVEKSVEFVKTLGEPDYIDEEIFIDEDEEDEGPTLFDDGDGDPLFEQALEIVLQQGRASASYIQRKLKVGYNRAARLVELMEERGIVGPAQGSKPRDLVRNPEIAHLRNPEIAHVRNPEMTGARREADRAEAGRPSLIADLETLPGQRVTGRDEED